MIVFKSISWQNFLSTGNTPMEISLDKSASTLIIGENGSGKSTVLDALCFGLFGKPFRRIKKDQLINSINERDCRVEVYFNVGRKKYLIIRGIRPTRFEIYIDGKLLNQDASARDYQRYLENNILKLNHRSFTQVVILGSSSFIPFMQLAAAARREVVEDILDIKIFSMMNVLLKQKIKILKERQNDITHEYKLLETKIQLTKDHIDKTKDKSKTSFQALEKKVEKNNKEVENLVKEYTKLEKLIKEWELEILPKSVKLDEDIFELNNIKWKMEQKSSTAKKEIKFFEENDDCPTCDQHIDNEFKMRAIEERSDKMITSACTLVSLDSQLKEMDARSGLYENIQHDTREHEVEIAKKKVSSDSILDYNKDLYVQMDELKNIDTELVEEKAKLKVYKEDLKTVEKEKNRLTEDQNYSIIAKQLLQDSGIKTKIIKKYLPIMNKLINSYLSAMDFHVQFELDETFNETIKSRYRDEFAYGNFSEGEKMRIDLALLFTWRQIAKMKNSTNTNLLVLDEIFDSSLDANGTDEFLKILASITKENTFIIYHKSDLNIDKFDDLIRFEKIQNFARMTT